MKRITLFLSLIVVPLCAMSRGREVRMSVAELRDRIMGGWAGQTIGCTYGGPTEFCWRGAMIPDERDIVWSDSAIVRHFDRSPGLYDDVYMDLTFLSVMDRLGIDAPVDSFAVAYARAPYPLWHANQVGRYNIQRGIMPPASGHWRNNPHADDIDYQIEADYAGLISPGMPNRASQISDLIGHIMNYGNGWYGGVYVGAMYSLAFTTRHIPTLVREALRVIPRKSTFHQCMADVMAWHAQHPDDWKLTWQLVEEKWSNEAGCSEGVMNPLDIDAMINCAYVVMGLLYGEGDFHRTMEISCRCGQDSDCNPATAAGILGTMIGYRAIPEQWKMALYKVENRPFAYTTLSLANTYDLNMRLALEQITAYGGSVNGEEVALCVQRPKPVRFEESFPGMEPDTVIENPTLQQLADLHFRGCAIVVSGYLKKKGGAATPRIAASIDGKLHQELPLPLPYHDRAIDLCWIYDLPQGDHVLSLRPVNPAEGDEIIPQRAIIYRRTSGRRR